MPSIKVRDTIQGVATYDKSKNIFFDYFYTYYEFGASIHHLSRLINENRSEKIILQNNEKLVLFLAEYAILRLLFGFLFLHYNDIEILHDTKPLDVRQIFDNNMINELSQKPNFRIKIPQKFQIKRTKNSLLLIEGDNLRLKISTAIIGYQTLQAITHRPIPKIMDIPIKILYEEEILSKVKSGDLLFYSIGIDIKIDFIKSKLYSLYSEIRRDSKFSDKVNFINDLINYLHEQLIIQTLIERIYQKIEEDRLELFFDMERTHDKTKQGS